MILALWLVFGSAFGLVCGLLAVGRNRSAVGWYFLGLVFGPLALAPLLIRQRRDAPSFL